MLQENRRSNSILDSFAIGSFKSSGSIYFWNLYGKLAVRSRYPSSVSLSISSVAAQNAIILSRHVFLIRESCEEAGQRSGDKPANAIAESSSARLSAFDFRRAFNEITSLYRWKGSLILFD